MNLVFISSEEYPNGGAAVNRHMAYAKGLAEAGNSVNFILLAKQLNPCSEFTREGVKYICVFPLNYQSNFSKLKKFFLHINSITYRREILNKIHKKEGIDAIILLDTFVSILIPIIHFAKKNNIKVLHERTEYPFVVGGNGFMMKLNLKIYLNFVLKRLDGIYVISEALNNYFNQILKNKVPIITINMIVDPSRFKVEVTEKINNIKYIAYCGSLDDYKDGVDILVRAFGNALTSQKINNDIKLMLIGDITESYKRKLAEIMEKEHFKSNVIFTNRVERKKVPELLNGSLALALARPPSKQAEGGFPTKLGEYLATGKPVIITNVGEIGNFLRDGFNAFIAKPGDVNSFSEKLIEVFENYPKALEIGKKGEKLVYNEFNYLKQAILLENFIQTLQSIPSAKK